MMECCNAHEVLPQTPVVRCIDDLVSLTRIARQTMNDSSTLYLFGHFCGDSPFWSDDILRSDVPHFTDCFQTTVLEWIPFLWLAVTVPWYLMALRCRPDEYPLPIALFSVIKSALGFAMFLLSCIRIWSVEQYGLHCNKGVDTPPSFYVGITLRCVSIFIMAVLIQVVRQKGVVNSVIIMVYWTILLICDIINLQDNISFQPQCPESIAQYIYFSLLCIQVFLHIFADRRSSLITQEMNKEKALCPVTEVSGFNHLFFAWFSPIVLSAYRRTLGLKDIWRQTPSLQCKNAEHEVLELWGTQLLKQRKKCANKITKVVKTGNRNGKIPNEETLLLSSSKTTPLKKNSDQHKPSLYFVLMKFCWIIWLKACLYKVLCLGFILIQPLVLREIISYVDERNKSGSPLWWGIVLTIGLLATGILESLFYGQAVYTAITLGLKMKAALIGSIYRKSLRMSNTAKKNFTVGEIVNLMSVDCQRILDATTYSFQVIALLFALIIGLLEIWDAAGIAFLGTIGTLVMMTILNAIFGKLQEKFQQKLLHLKGKRIKVLAEILNGMKVLKMYAWEPLFADKIKAIRQKEVHYLMRLAFVNACSIVLTGQSPFMMSYFVFLIYTLMSPNTNHLTSETAFLVIAAANVLRYEVALLPLNITGFIQAYVSIGRIQRFLWQNELTTDAVNFVDSAEYAVSIDNGHFTWDQEEPTFSLRGIDFKVPEGNLVAVVGHVGSGKSSLISAILGEMEKIQGNVTVQGTVAYVPQEAWIQNLTLRDNILYGRRYKERKYDKIITACALKPDLNILPAGDLTEIGQKGTNLSGGQKQRVSLARAVFSNSDIYLLDDPLSAVDSNVGKDIFQNVIGRDGVLRNKTRILVTHGIRWLPKVDTILVMDDGIIVESGTYHELLQHNGQFAQLLRSYLINDSEDEDSDTEMTNIRNEIVNQLEHLTSDGLTSDDNAWKDKNSLKKRPKAGNTIAKMFIKASVSEQTEVDKKNNWRLTQEEAVKEGRIKAKVILDFVKAMGVGGTIASFAFLTAYQALLVYSTFWLAIWTEDTYLTNSSLVNTTLYAETTIHYLVVYSVLGIIQGLLLFLFGLLAMTRIVRATQRLHTTMLNSIMRSPMAFFDTTPMGRVINRFSSDIDLLDSKLPDIFRLWCIMLMNVIGTVAVIIIQTPILVIVLVVLGIVFGFLVVFYLPTARQIKRLESVTRSPVYNHFSETITGASVIRAYRSGNRFIEESHRRVDQNTSFYHGAIVSTRWVGVAMETTTNILPFGIALFAILYTDLNGGEIGLMLSYALQVVISSILFVESVSEMEMNVISAERIIEYTDLPPEAEWVCCDYRPPQLWPDKGNIEFRSYSTRYRPGLELVLRKINCHIYSGEKIGIVGRTGAGKSSLTQALFRLIESCEGDIIIDGVKASLLGLHDLRSRITILPQDPVLFSGTLKSNVDPGNKFSEADIWKALERAHLKRFVINQGKQLVFECGEGGQNLSVGQRQLVCLGRALLHKNMILILDEATAAVDMETDELIQETIRQEFAECTVLTVAHRLNTIMDYDRVLVMDKGIIAEFDTPKSLLQNTSTLFYGMAKDADLVDWYDINQK